MQILYRVSADEIASARRRFTTSDRQDQPTDRQFSFNLDIRETAEPSSISQKL